MRSCDEIKSDIKRLETELREARKQEQLTAPSNIIYTDEYGWVKLLPCGIGDVVYTWDYIYENHKGVKKRRRAFHASGVPLVKNPESIRIIAVEMLRTFYQSFGKAFFLTREEAEKAAKEWEAECRKLVKI